MPWIYGIARRKLVGHYRREERAVRLVSAEAADAPAPTRGVFADDIDDGLSDALESLLVRARISFRRAYRETPR